MHGRMYGCGCLCACTYICTYIHYRHICTHNCELIVLYLPACVCVFSFEKAMQPSRPGRGRAMPILKVNVGQAYRLHSPYPNPGYAATLHPTHTLQRKRFTSSQYCTCLLGHAEHAGVSGRFRTGFELRLWWRCSTCHPSRILCTAQAVGGCIVVANMLALVE
jgi:hypothetical protein